LEKKQFFREWKMMQREKEGIERQRGLLEEGKK
jgi:hypothetical protein